MNQIRRLVALLLGWRVVWLRDYDGEVVCRLAKPTPYGMMAYRMSRLFGISPVILLPGGKVTGASYVHEWRPDPNSGDGRGFTHRST